TGTSNGNSLFLEIDSDGSNSCQDNQQSTWNFEVECTPGCVDPDGTYSYDLCTQLITVELNFDGDGASAGVRYILNGGAPVDVTGLNAPATEVLGPFTPGDAVQVLLLHENDGNCNKNLGVINIVAPAGQPNLVASASPATICAGSSSTLNAVAQTATPPAVPAYAFSQALSTYSPISGGVLFGDASSDDQYFTNPATPLASAVSGPGTPIGFNFTYNGVSFDRIGVNANGWISFGQSALTPSVNMTTSSAYTPLSSTTAVTPAQLRNRIAAMAADLQGQAGSSIRVETIGTAPNRVCVIQWTNYRRWNQTGHSLNFQVRLYEGTNTVELQYGPMTWIATASTAIQVI
ncbi:MAG TPA: hypothetical protein PKY96_16805, partial [Flavobacteriales bacterium]|nr:hypothetical protein [Flavobacteriales bacterium]